MKALLAVLIVAAGALLSPPAEARGCLLGMAFGAWLGHKYHHTFIGAAGGCAAGRVMADAWESYKAKHPDATWESFFAKNEDRLKAMTGFGAETPAPH
jgi:hypothetical protein